MTAWLVDRTSSSLRRDAAMRRRFRCVAPGASATIADVPDVEETRLPGVGVRFAFTTAGGERLGVIAHRSGKRELLVYDRGDPDTCDTVIGLGEDDTRTLVDLLGGSEVTERIGAAIRQSLDGLELEWAVLGGRAPAVGRPISEFGLRSRKGLDRGDHPWRGDGHLAALRLHPSER